MATKPRVLVIAGHDPTGGAGFQADIEALAAHSVHALPLISCLTVQDTRGVHQLVPLDPKLVRQQAETLLADVRADLIKVGLLGSVEMARLVLWLKEQLPEARLILDPVLAAGGGGAEATAALVRVLREEILPQTWLATPNLPELERLTGSSDTTQGARTLLDEGCRNLLVTGTHAHSARVENRLFDGHGACRVWSWPRLAGSPHGSGCTLASAVAAGLARGLALEDAVDLGQCYTWRSLQRAWSAGTGQQLPDRSPDSMLPLSRFRTVMS